MKGKRYLAILLAAVVAVSTSHMWMPESIDEVNAAATLFTVNSVSGLQDCFYQIISRNPE